jgi:hypothetical protein
MSLFIAALFFALTPGILLSLPSGGSKKVVALTHAVVFALIFHFTHKAIAHLSQQYELFNGGKTSCIAAGKKPVGGAPCCSGSAPNNDNGMC